LPLGLTLLTTAAFLLVPALLMGRFPRPRAIGLEKLMATVSLLQSFRADPDRPVPEIWKERFGPESADKLWRYQSRLWWQFWDGHADGPPFLALSSRGLPEPLSPGVAVPPLTVGDLSIFPPDRLSRQILQDRLQPQVRSSPGVRLRCLPRMESEQAVFWRPAALGVLLGPLASFLQGFQEGCLSLTIGGDGLLWRGEAASVEGMVLRVPEGLLGAPELPVVPPPSPDVLLEAQGPSLERLMAGLLARELIRQPLAERYGLGPTQLTLLRQTPFRLVLRPRDQGPFQASIELTLVTGLKQAQWKEWLERLADRLRKEDLRLLSPAARPGVSQPPPPPAGSKRAAVWPQALWQRADGVVVGGWRWHGSQAGGDQITLFLGPPPSVPTRFVPSPVVNKGGMLLLARPQQLEDRGLLPGALPQVVKRSDWLWMAAEPFPGLGPEAPLNQLQGTLRLRP